MYEYKKIKTSKAVIDAIWNEHRDQLTVFGSYSYPSGNERIGYNRAEMFTSWGFKDSDYPIFEHLNTWKIDNADKSKRINEKHEYWLCCPLDKDKF